MKTSQISHIRLAAQQVTQRQYPSAKDLVSWMGAMQAQDYAMCKWAVGIRTGCNENDIQTAIDKGEIIRTHILRPTWHIVSADDIHWMLDLTAPQIKQFMKSNNKLLGLTDDIFRKCYTLIEKELSKGTHLTREELATLLQQSKINTMDTRLSYILCMVELEGILCSGCYKNGKQTYALLAERVPKKMEIPKEEALYKLAHRYFMSHAPATLADFTWWSGLLVREAKLALELIKDDFISETVDGKKYLLHESFADVKSKKTSVFLLPAFDEFLISYKDRSASISAEHMRKAFSNNGIFWPVIIADGQAIGVWKRTVKKDEVRVSVDLFYGINETVKKKIQQQGEGFAKFLGKELLWSG